MIFRAIRREAGHFRRFFASEAVRYHPDSTMWGDVPVPLRDHPRKHAKERGLRIHSSVDAALLEHVYRSVGDVYLGCLH